MKEEIARSIPVNKYRKAFLALTSFLIFSAILFKLLYSLPEAFDLSHADEAGYLNDARGAFRADGFLYLLWLRCLLGILNPVPAYYTNLGVLIVFFGVSSYIWFRVASGSNAVALLMAALMTVSSMNVLGWPYITRLSAAVLMLAAGALILTTNPYRRIMVAVTSASILSYIRPEFSMTVVLIGLYALWYSWSGRNSEPSSARLLAVISVGFLLLLIIANPMDRSRSMVAFAQHYALGLHKSGLWPEEPWTTADRVMERDFPGAGSFIGAIVINPTAILWHIWRNVTHFPSEIVDGLRPYWLNGIVWKSITALVLCGLTLRVILRLNRPNSDWRHYLTQWKEKGIFFLFLLPLIVSILLIYPRQHYLIMILPILVGFGLWRIKLPERWYIMSSAMVLLLFFAYTVPWTASLRPGFRIPSSVRSIHGAGFCTIKDRVNFLNSHRLRNDVLLLSPLGWVQPYLNTQSDGHWKEIPHYTKSTPFPEFMAAHSINAVWVNQDLLNDVRYRDDEPFKEFLLNPPGGWKKIEVKDCPGQYMLIQEASP